MTKETGQTAGVRIIESKDVVPVITEPGLYDLPEAVYHGDDFGPVPTLNKSTAHVLLTASPRHAWMQHPRLNPEYVPEEKSTFDKGKAAETIMLNSDGGVEIIEADSWRTKKAKQERDDAREANKVPMLRHEYEAVQTMVAAGQAQLKNHADASGAFIGGKAQQTLVWKEGEVWCRALLDYWKDKSPIFDDYKTTDASAHPDQWGKRICFDTGCDIQDAFYSRGIRAVLGIENPTFRFIVQERKPPYALCVIELDRQTREFADKKVAEAIRRWAWCLENNFWPGYPNQTVTIEMPPWREAEWLAEENRQEIAKEQKVNLLELAMDMQAPV